MSNNEELWAAMDRAAAAEREAQRVRRERHARRETGVSAALAQIGPAPRCYKVISIIVDGETYTFVTRIDDDGRFTGDWTWRDR